MFIIGHGFSHSTFGSNKMKVLGESTTEYSEPSPTVSHFGEIGSLQGVVVAYFCDRWFMILNREAELHSQHFPWMEDSQFVLGNLSKTF